MQETPLNAGAGRPKLSEDAAQGPAGLIFMGAAARP